MLIFFLIMCRCVLLHDAVSTHVDLFSSSGASFEGFAGVVVVAAGCLCLTDPTNKRSSRAVRTLLHCSWVSTQLCMDKRRSCLAVRAAVAARTAISCLSHMKRLWATWTLMALRTLY